MSKLLSVFLPDDLRDSTDALAAAQGRTPSEVVCDALRSYLWREEGSQEPPPPPPLPAGIGIPETGGGGSDERK